MAPSICRAISFHVPLFIAFETMSLAQLLLFGLFVWIFLNVGHVHVHCIGIFLDLLIEVSLLPFSLPISPLIFVSVFPDFELLQPQAGIYECLSFDFLSSCLLPSVQCLNWHGFFLEDLQVQLAFQPFFELE